MTLRRVQHWLAHQDDPVDLVLVCREAPGEAARPEEATVVRLVGCAVEAAPPHELVELLTVGARTVAVDLGTCAAADAAAARLAPVLTTLEDAGVTALRIERGASRLPPSRGAVEPLDAGRMPVGRRQALGLGRGRPLPREDADPHDRLVAALRAVLPAGAAAAPPGPGASAGPAGPAPAAASPAPVLQAPGCTMCAVCVRGCPRGALTLTSVPAGADMTIATLQHEPAACDGCRRCVDLCPTDALQAAGAHPWSTVLAGQPVGVVSAPTHPCRRCGTPVAPSVSLCEVCAYRRANPFGSVRVGA